MNQVFGARLLITGLVAEEGFGVEFLEYIAPPGGKEYPKNSTPLDHWYWHTTMVVNDIDSMVEKIQKANYTIISNGIVPLKELNYDKAIIVRDPDGHAILLAQLKN